MIASGMAFSGFWKKGGDDKPDLSSRKGRQPSSGGHIPIG